MKCYPITRLGRALELWEVDTPLVSRRLADESGKFVSPTHRPLLPLWRHPWY
jgi:hypothetical protein